AVKSNEARVAVAEGPVRAAHMLHVQLFHHIGWRIVLVIQLMVPRRLEAGPPPVFAVFRNFFDCLPMRSGLAGGLPGVGAPVQNTKAGDGFICWTAENISLGVEGCGQLLCAGRLSPPATKVNRVEPDPPSSLPVPGRAARSGIWADAMVPPSIAAIAS